MPVDAVEGASKSKIKAKRRPATFDDLIKKKPRETDVTVRALGDDNEELELVVRMRAIGTVEYDELIAKHPPTRKQRDEGAQFNTDTFAPALISAVALEPRMTLEQATELYNSPQWSGGEIGGLFFGAQRLCQAGIDVPFNGAA